MGKPTPELVPMPQAVDAEEAVLGGILRDPTVLPAVLDILPRSDIFSRPHHGHIYRAMQALYQADQQVDVVTAAT